EEFARQLAAAGLHIALVARRQTVLDELAASIAATSGVECRAIATDLTAPDATARVAAATDDLEIGLLVYNAGADTMAKKFHDRSIDEVMHLVMLNVVTPTQLCHRFGGAMRTRGRGGIILLGSMAGLAGTGWVATYAASKAYDQMLAEGLWRELKADGVDVLGLIAGATATPAHERMGARTTEQYPPMDPADVARAGIVALGHGPVHVAGMANRQMFDALHTTSRVDLIEAMTGGTKLLFDVVE
ncbi:MAG TPA: SDR family NAD(P)-dependent oxidoreductase, partial [Acidimicrobiales bacterium]|nr:SDR family NAD(P)-dependent oxidoreductase [Acidimicrobiales bacterium]